MHCGNRAPKIDFPKPSLQWTVVYVVLQMGHQGSEIMSTDGLMLLNTSCQRSGARCRRLGSWSGQLVHQQIEVVNGGVLQS